MVDTYYADAPGVPQEKLVKLADYQALESKLDRYRWIPVDERLPPDEMSVLAFKSNGHVDKTCRYAGGWLLPSLEPHVTHWMPLPEPPK